MADGNCEDTLHELYEFLDGEITDDDRDRIREHLEACPPCFEAYDFEAELKQVVADKCREHCSEDLRRRIGQAIGIEPA